MIKLLVLDEEHHFLQIILNAEGPLVLNINYTKIILKKNYDVPATLLVAHNKFKKYPTQSKTLVIFLR